MLRNKHFDSKVILAIVTLALLMVPALAYSAPEDDLVGYWAFEDGPGSTMAADDSGYGNDGTVVDAVWTGAGQIGGALDFDGAGDRVQVPDSASLGFASGQMTLACWMNANNLSNRWVTLMHRTRADIRWYNWQLYARASDAPTANRPVFRIDWDGDRIVDANEQVQGDIFLSPGTWYHIAATYDGSQMKFYIDGTLRGTTNVSGVIPNGGRDIWIGGNEPWGEYFDGVIDEVRVYDRALNQAEIAALMSQEMVTVPDVVGLDQASAEADIVSAGLAVGAVSTQSSATVPAGDVISQDPTADASVPGGTAVDLVVSSGPEPVSVPNVVDLPQAAAEAAISGAGLTVGAVTTAYSTTVPAGDVISQNPAAGASVPVGTAVDLVVSLGPAPVSVPDVVGLAQAAAEAAITGAGLTVGTVTTENSDTISAGVVISQNPTDGTTVPSGTAVDILVSLGPVVMVNVPAVEDLPQAAAEAAITGAGLIVGTVTTANSDTVPAGNVISQDPTGGTSVLSGTMVDLLVSLGPVTVDVPEVVGLTQAAAEAAITGAGLTVGTVTTANSDTVPAGNVISQDPAGGTPVVLGTAVDLVISLGPVMVIVPDVVGVSEAAAEAAITGAGLVVGTVATANSDTVPAGDVISQDPTDGTSVPMGTAVDLVISLGSIPEDLVGYWAFEDGPGTMAADDSGYGNDGTVVDAVWTGAGQIGGALDFDGAGDRVQVPDSASLGFASGQMTLACWMNADNLSNRWVTLMHRTRADIRWYDWQLYARASDAPTANRPVFRIDWDGDRIVDANEQVQGDIVLSPGTWYHIAATYDGSQMKFYIDGTLRGTTNVSGVIPNGGRDIWIGGNEPWGEYFDGVIDEVRVYDRALNQAEIAALMSQEMVTVPDVVGLDQASAEADIVSAGLAVGAVSTQSSATVPAGDVISQDPTADASVPGGTAVDLVVSSGPEPVSVPNVVDLPQAAAEAAISGAGLTVGAVTTAYSTTVPAGDVISQNPAAGASVPVGTAVDLVVSLGPAPVSVPDVVGLAQAAAEAAITGAGLTVGTVTTENSDTISAGVVISQNPTDGTTVPSGTAVDILVSLGPVAMVNVPAVEDLPQAAAEAAITGAGLIVGTVTTANSDTVPAGNVISQDPTGGTSVLSGTMVDLLVSLGPVTVDVPEVVGLTQAAAEAAITGAGLIVGTVTTANSDTVPAGNVISQDPAGGTPVVLGTAVDLVISLGPVMVIVPDVVGVSEAAAEAAITGAGLVVGTVATANSDTVPAGDVISQDPTDGTSVPMGTAVDLVISLGSIPEDLVGYWAFEDGSGGTAADDSGYGNDGTVVDAVWTGAGQIGGALDFDGAGDRVQVPDSASLGFASNQMTLACWMNANSLSAGWVTLMHRTRADIRWYDWQLYARASDAPTANRPVFRIDWDGDRIVDANEQVQGDIFLSPGTWYHIAATYDGSQMKFYIDGTLRGTTNVSGVIPNGGRDIWIGGNEPWGEYFDGVIDEVQVYDRALAETEIQALMGDEPPVVPYSGVCEDFEDGFTLGQSVGTHADWFDGGNGPVVNAGIGVAGSVGLAPASAIFTWAGQPFDWNAPEFQGIIFQGDFQTDGSGQFDDDRIGWMTTDSDVDSTNFFGVQLDHTDGGIVTYWRDSSDERIQDPIVDLTGTKANTWYRFRADITKLTATSARIDVSLVELDAGGTPIGAPLTGTVEDTSLWPGGVPPASYFTGPMWPAYKNFNALDGSADNVCFEIIERFAFVVVSDTHTSSSQTAVENHLQQVRDWVIGPTPDMPAPEFMVIVGDFPNWNQTEASIDSVVGEDFLWFPVIGNHEISDDINNFYYVRDTMVPALPYVANYGPDGSVNTNYSWTYGNAHFVAINAYWDGSTNPGADQAIDGDIRSELRAWIANDLMNSGRTHNFAFVHEPAYPDFRHVGDSLDQYPANRDAFVTTLDSNNVEALFSGHTHYYEHDVSTEFPLLGDIHQITSGRFGTVGAQADGATITYVLVAGPVTTYKVYHSSSTGYPMTLIEQWSIGSEAPTEIPADPSDLAALATSYAQVSLTWTDNADNEDHFQIERSTAGGPYEILTNVPADTEAYIDMGLAAETDYCYRVVAVNIVGPSGPTGDECDTTPERPPVVGTCEDFEAGFTLGQTVGTHPDWFDGGGGPVVTNGVGVAGSIGLAPSENIFTRVAESFDWNAPDFVGVNLQMDFQTDGSGHFDDDRVGWMIADDTSSSDLIFGVQMDPGGSGYNIEAYWDGDTFGDDGGRTSIVDLPALTANAWYRLRAEITRLTATSARIDVTLTALDAGGNPGAVVVTGSIPDTDLLPNTATNEIPNPAYFTGPMWPAYKNYQTIGGAADNPCYEVISGALVEVPYVEGFAQAVAEAAITDALLTVGTVTTAYDDLVGAGDVISQDPAAGASVPEGSAVDLVVSLGPVVMVDLPNWVGLSQGDAEAAIVAAGFAVGTVTGQYDDFIEAGDVISQDPAAGASVPSGSAVDLVVSLGLEPPIVTTCEDLESGFTIGQTIGAHAEWYDGGGGPVVTTGNGVAGSTGLAAAANIFTWVAHPFDWNAADFVGVNFQMDFKTDGSGNFDDDRLGWMISDSSTSSADIFGVQLDQIDGGIVTYWRNGSTRIQDQIVDLTGTQANTWYRFRAEITKLTATSARIDVTLTELDGSGNPTGTPYTGTVTDTSSWGGGSRVPNTSYFTAATIWPAYKNFTTAAAPADNPCFEVITGSVPLADVPDVVGLAQADAETAITDALLTVGTVTTANSDSVPAGDVISQNPAAGASVPENTAVDLVVSLGPAAELTAGDVIISGVQAWNDPSGQSPGEFIELFNTTDQTISLENMQLISRVDNDTDGVLEVDWQLAADLTGKSIAPHSFFLIAESGVAVEAGGHDVATDMDLATGEGGWTERAISIELVIDSVHMDYVLYGRHDDSTPAGELPPGDIPFDGSSWPRSEVVRNTTDAGSYYEGLIRRESAADLYAGYDVEGFYTDEDALGDGYPSGVWTSPHDRLFGAYEARNSQSPKVMPLVTVDVPDVVGLTEAAADAAITGAGLTVGTVSTANSDTVAAGDVISQDPAAGSSVAGGTAVDLVVSLGSALVTVPAVVGLAEAAADAAITGAGLTVGTVSTANSDTVAAGDVISQDPAAGSSVAGGTAVDLVVSLGPVVPPSGVDEDFESGFTLGQTVGAHADWFDGGSGPVVTAGNGVAGSIGLAAANDIFTWVAQPFTWSDLAISDAVLVRMDFQTDGAGHFDDDRVGWMISNSSINSNDIFGIQMDPGGDGPSGYNIEAYWDGDTFGDDDGRTSIVNLPVLPGDSWYRFQAVIVKLTATSARIDVTLTELDGSGNPGAVVASGSLPDTALLDEISTDNEIPNPGYFTAATMWPAYKNYNSAAAAPADNAHFEILTGLLLDVPDVVGLTEAAADAAITGAGLTVGTVTTANSDTVPAGDVISQNPVAGSSVAGETAVDLVVSSGPALVTVPNVVGLAEAAADAAITGAGLTVGTVSTANSDTVPAGEVISQDPVAGSSVAGGTAVDFVVSLGPVVPPSGVDEDFESGFTLGQPVGTHADWFDGGSVPVVTAGNGVAGSIGLAAANDIFTWVAQPFTWSDLAISDAVLVRMDFQTDGAGHFDDDRVGWMISNSSINSNDIFGIQMDPGGDGPSGYNIEAYWDGDTFGDDDGRTSIVNLPVLPGDSWYRFQAVIVKLTATSARIDVTLTELDGSGNPGAVVASGSLPDTALLDEISTDNEIPNPGYFTAATMWPAYKNYTAAAAPADNAHFEILTGLLLDVPDVVGLAQADAETAITGAGLTVGTVSTANSDTVPAGDVISQNPVAGSSVAGETAVDLVVSLGSALVTVPNVVGLAEAAADAAITGAGLTVGTVSTANSDTVAAGDVISQDPAAGSSVASGTAVDLVVSLGPVVPPSGVGEDFESGFAGSNVGDHEDWFDGGSGPVATAGFGVGGSVGLPADNDIFTWIAHPFTWSDLAISDAVLVRMDFQTDGSGNFDDDRVGWMISDSSINSNDIFGVQLDPGGSGQNIEAYWDGDVFGDDDGRTSIVDLPALPANAWYRFQAVIVKLTATSARIDVTLTELDSSGNEGSVVASGTLDDTALLLPGSTTDASPNEGYFTATTMWPAYKNHNGTIGYADNAHFEILTGLLLDVPDVVGLVQADAETAITGAGLTVGTVSTANSDTVPAGDVISQNPVAGSSVAGETAVDLVVSLGSALVTVPNVVGQAEAAADAAITGAGLTVGTVSTANSDTVPAGEVISQDPVAGSSVAGGTAVDLVVSLGPVVPPSGVGEDFESGFAGSNVGDHEDWFDGGSGPVATAGFGVGGSVGLPADNDIFTWIAHPFTWSDLAISDAVLVRMDFQTDGSGNFDDDRVGWMISDSSINSNDIFGVQLDPGGSGQNIEAYWDGDVFGDDDGRTSIVDLPALPANAWYRFQAVIVKLTATSARIDVTLTELDSSGNEGSVVASGTLDDTALLLPGSTTDASPNEGYFTATTMWPAYKNHNGTIGYADNAYFEIITSETVIFAAFGDYGNGTGDANEQAVADLVDSFSPDFIITTGDNNYINQSSTAAWDDVVGDYYGQYIRYPAGSTSDHAPGPDTNAFFPSLGNHDWDAGGQEAYFDLPGNGIPSSNTSGNERYYDFVRGPVHFFAIDSDSREPDGRASDSNQALWLQAQLAASTSPWKIVFMHHPPYSSSSSHGSEIVMQWPYDEWGATAVFAGHDHVYERIVRDDYVGDDDDILYFTTGAGGRSLYSFGTPVPGSEVRYNSNYGSMIVEATAASITFEFWSVAGDGSLIDTYTITK